MDCPACHSSHKAATRFCSFCGARLNATHRHVAERSPAEDGRFRRYFEHAPHGIFISDEQGRIVEVNPAACRITGYDNTELLQLTIADTLPAEYRSEGLAQFAHAREIGVARTELPFIGKRGRCGWWSVEAVKLSQTRFLFFVTETTERKRAEEELRASEARLRLLVDQATDGIFLHGPGGVIVDANCQACNSMGYVRDEVIGMNVAEFDPFIDTKTLQEIEQKLIAGQKVAFDSRHRRKDGSSFPVEVRLSPVGVDGQPSAVGVVRDITDRIQAQEALREGHRYYSALFEQSAVAVAQLDSRTGRFLKVNQCYCEIIGYSREEMLEMDFQTITHPDDLREDLDNMEQLRAGHFPTFRMEKRLFRKDGSVIWVRLTVVPLWPRGADPDFHLAFVEDFTERRKIEQSLRLMQFSIDRAVDSVFWVAPNAEILYVNDAACRTLGYSREELIGKTVPDIDPNFPAEAWPAHWEELKQRGSFSFESDHFAKDGTLINTEVTVNYIEFEGREYNCATMRDITERKRAGAALLESNTLLRNIVDSSESFIYLVDREGRFLLLNRQLETFLQVSRDDLVGQTRDLVFPEHIVKEHRRNDLQVLRTERPVQCEETTELNGPRTYLSVKFPVRNSAGKIYAIGGISTDITERNQAKLLLLQSEERFRLVWEAAADGMRLTDAEGRIVAANEAFCRIVGKPRIEVEGLLLSDLYAAPERDRIQRRHRERFAERNIETHVERHMCLWDGRAIWLDVTNCRIDTDPARPLLLGIFRDITERKRAEQTLRMMQYSVDRVSDAVFWVAPDARILYANDAAYRRLGHTRDELLTMSVFDFDPDFPATAWPDHWTDLKQRGSMVFESHHRAKDGRIIPVEINANFVSFDGQEFNFATSRDISERKHIEDALRASEARYRALVESSGDAIFMLDAEGNIRSANAAALRMHGYSLAELLAMNIRDLDSPEAAQLAPHRLVRLLRGETLRFELEHRRKDGTLFPLEVIATPMQFNDETYILKTERDISDRKRAENELRRMEERFSKLFYASPYPIMLATYPDGLVVEVNDAFLRLFDFHRADIIGKTTIEIDLWADLADRRIMIERLRTGQPVQNIAFKFRTKSGAIRVILLSVELVQLDGQKHSLAMSIDITDRRRAEEALRISEERLALVMRGTNDGIWDWNLLTNEEYHSPRWNEILGYTEGELPSASASSFFDLIHPDDKAAVEQAIRRNFEGIQRYAVEFRLRCKNGDYRWLLSRGETFRDDSGRPIRMVGSMTDISERKQAEQSLRESEERYRLLFETCADAVFLLDRSGRIRAANPSAARMHGYARDELLAMNIRDLDGPAGARLAPERLSRLEAGETLHFEVDHRRKDGSTFPVEVVATPMHIGDEAFILAFDRDISERKQSEAQNAALRDQLAHMARLGTMGEMASGLAHELNQPLASLCLYANSAMILGEGCGSTQLSDCLHRVNDLSMRAGEIVRRMRAFVGHRSSHRSSHNINVLIEEVLKIMASDVKSSGTTITCEFHDEMPTMLIDGIQIQQVLVNLIRNALESMDDTEVGKRCMTIRTELLDDGVRVSVADSGSGLDPAIAGKLFHPFHTTKPDGLGLGLPICRTLIEAHRGRIDSHPNPSGGTTFSFVLPRAPQDFVA